MNELVQNLAAVIHTLDTISVSGKQNLMRLSGCIDALEHILGALEAAKQPTAEVKDNGISC